MDPEIIHGIITSEQITPKKWVVFGYNEMEIIAKAILEISKYPVFPIIDNLKIEKYGKHEFCITVFNYQTKNEYQKQMSFNLSIID